MGAYLRPTRLEDALDVLAGPGVWTLLAGATDLYPARVGRSVDDDVLDLTAIDDLRTISVSDGTWRIPALATWTDVVRRGLPPAFDGLVTAARAIGGVQIQNRATVCGNLCNASPAADGLPNLMALDARVELASAAGGRREIPIGAFVVGNRRTVRRPDELVTAVLVPDVGPGSGPTAPAGDGGRDAARASFLKLGSRAYLVISVVSVAALVVIGPGDGRISTARIVVGACSEVPQRVEAAERRLIGQPADRTLARTIEADDLAALTPIDDVRATAAYRRDAALALVRRAVAEVLA